MPDVASFFVKKDGGVVRYSLPQGQAESALGAGRDQWHMAAFSSTDARTMRLTVDGREVFSTTNTAFDGLLNALTGINEVSIGGYREADGAVRHGFTGEISDVLVTSQAVSDEDAKTITLAGARSDGPGGARAELFNDSPDNTWAFTGGADVAGGFSQTRGVRNYVGQFEEYIRWDRAQSGNKVHAMQRYTVNLARPGAVLSDVVADFDTRVAPLSPKATAYLIGPDDYAAGEAGVPAFQGSLRQFIDKAVGVRSGAFAVVQLPYQPKEGADLAERYAAAAKDVVNEYAGKLGQGRPLTWLFMGDSITHGALHTKGYDAVPQVVEKYVHEVLGRKDDVVVNTAVSGSTTADTLAQIGPRLENYPADVVSLMIGTNDSTNAATPPRDLPEEPPDHHRAHPGEEPRRGHHPAHPDSGQQE